MDPETIAAIVSALGGILGQGQQNREINAAEGGLNYWDQRITQFLSYINSPKFLNTITGPLNQQSDLALKDVMNRMGGGIANPSGTINDWRDATLSADTTAIDSAKQWIASTTGSMEQGQAGQYQQLLNTIMGQGSPLAAGLMGVANSGALEKLFGKKPGATGDPSGMGTNTPPIAPYNPAPSLPPFGSVGLPAVNPTAVGGSGYFGGGNGYAGSNYPNYSTAA
jgi:hypothetical protein